MKRTLLIFALLICLLGGVFFYSQAQTPVLGPGFYDERNPAIVYAADVGYSWSAYPNASYYLSTFMYTTQTTANAHNIYFNFWGSGIILYIEKAASFSPEVEVCIDGPCTSISMYNSTTVYQIPVEFCCYGYGEHVVEMHSAQTGFWGIDAVNVLPPQEQPTIPPVVVTIIFPPELTVEVQVELTALIELTEEAPDYEVTLEVEGVDDQAMVFQYKADAGQVAMILLQAATVFILLVISVIVVLKWILSR